MSILACPLQIVAALMFAIAATHLFVAWRKWRSDFKRGDLKNAGKFPCAPPRAPPPPPPSSMPSVDSVTYSANLAKV